MEQLIFGSLIVWVLGRIAKKKAEAPAPGTIAPAPGSGTSYGMPLGPPIPTNQPGGSGTPQGQQVVLLNAILANNLPCIDPAGKSRVFQIKEMNKERMALQKAIDDESQRQQPDEAYINQLSNDLNIIMQALQNAGVIHLQKCQKYFEDFAQRSQTPTQTFSPNTTAQQQRSMQ